MAEIKFTLKEVENIVHLSKKCKEIKYDGLILVDPEMASNLLSAIKRYPTVFELQIGRLERQLEKEDQSKRIMENIIIARNPFAAIGICGLGDIEYRKQCVELYESLSDKKRKEFLEDPHKIMERDYI